MGKWKANKSACRSHTPKAGELGAWSCMLGADHRCLCSGEDTQTSVPHSASKEDRRPCLAWGLILGLPAGTKTVVCVSREEAGSWSERSPSQLQLFAQCRACPGCTHVLPGPWLGSKESSMGNRHFALLETRPLQIVEEKAAKWSGQNQVLQPGHLPNDTFLWDGD